MKRIIVGLMMLLLLASVACSGTTTTTSPKSAATTQGPATTTQESPMEIPPLVPATPSITPTLPTSTTSPYEILGQIIEKAKALKSYYYESNFRAIGEDGITTTQTWVKDDKVRYASMADGDLVVNIRDWDTLTSYEYRQTENRAIVGDLDPYQLDTVPAVLVQLMNYEPSIIGEQNLDGKACLIFEFYEPDAAVKVWIWRDYGFPVRFEAISNDGTWLGQIQNIDLNCNIPDSLFELPPGVVIVSAPDESAMTEFQTLQTAVVALMADSMVALLGAAIYPASGYTNDFSIGRIAIKIDGTTYNLADYLQEPTTKYFYAIGPDGTVYGPCLDATGTRINDENGNPIGQARP